MAKPGWLRVLCDVTGLVNQELLLKNGEKATLAEIAKRVGRKALSLDCPRGEARYDPGLVPSTEVWLPGSSMGRNNAPPEGGDGWDRRSRI